MKKIILIIALLLYVSGCAKEKNKVTYMSKDIDSYQPNGLLINDSFQEINIDEGYELYLKAKNNLEKEKGFKISTNIMNYADGENIYDLIRTIFINNYKHEDMEVYLEMHNYVNNVSQRVYVINQEYYMQQDSRKVHYLSDKCSMVIDENIMFLNIEKNYIRKLSEFNNGNSTILKFELEIPFSELEIFYGLRDYYIQDPIYIIEIDSNNRFKRSLQMEQYAIENQNLSKVETVFESYDKQNISFPADLESWEDYREEE